jgi:hypothetical protein
MSIGVQKRPLSLRIGMGPSGCFFVRLTRGQFLRPGLTRVRGGEADALDLADISMVYGGQIRGVCLSRSGGRRRFFDSEDLLRH